MSYVTEEEAKVLEARVKALERSYNKLVTAITSFVTLQQLNQLNVLTQTELDQVQKTLESVLDRLQRLEDDPGTY